MIKIIYGVADNSSTCELIFPKQDTVGITHLVNQSIIGNDIPESIVGSHCYSIRFVGEFSVFSKIHIVYDCLKRRGYRAFMIALNKVEATQDYDVLQKISELEDEYKKNEENIKQEDEIPEIIEIDNIKTKNETITTYYNDDEDKCKLEDYFKFNENYKEKYETIYFINENLKNKPKDPYKALKYAGKVVGIESITKRITPFNPPIITPPETIKTDPQSGTKNEKWEKWKLVIIGIIIGLILGLIPTVFIYDNFNLFTGKKTVMPPIVKEPDDTILQEGTVALDEVIETQNTTTSEIPVTPSKKTEEQKVKPIEEMPVDSGRKYPGTKPNTTSNVQNFLQEGCLKMTLNEIDAEIRELKKTAKGNDKTELNLFGNFLEILKKKPVDKTKLDNFKNTNKLNPNYEYVKFLDYLIDNWSTISTTNIKGITNMTFERIEEMYGK